MPIVHDNPARSAEEKRVQRDIARAARRSDNRRQAAAVTAALDFQHAVTALAAEQCGLGLVEVHVPHSRVHADVVAENIWYGRSPDCRSEFVIVEHTSLS